MKRLALAISVSVIAAACSSSSPAGPGSIAAGSATSTDAKPSTAPRNWVAHLTGDQEVDPSRETRAQGQVKYQLSADGTELHWQLIASNIDNAFMAHIHCCVSPTANGPIVLWLKGQPPASSIPRGTGPQNGVLSSGTATAANLVGSLAGQPLSALIAQMDAGMTYTNVHTDDGTGATNTGPGDFPNGEVRGQNRPAGH